MSDFFMDRVLDAHNTKVETIGNIIYVGTARIGDLPSDPKWSIQRFDKTVGVSSGWAGSNANYDKIWNDKETYIYG